jgi:hypothetical protein
MSPPFSETLAVLLVSESLSVVEEWEGVVLGVGTERLSLWLLTKGRIVDGTRIVCVERN